MGMRVTGWWSLVTLLASLFNTAAILYWQRANETRLDHHLQRIRNIEAHFRLLVPGTAKRVFPSDSDDPTNPTDPTDSTNP